MPDRTFTEILNIRPALSYYLHNQHIILCPAKRVRSSSLVALETPIFCVSSRSFDKVSGFLRSLALTSLRYARPPRLGQMLFHLSAPRLRRYEINSPSHAQRCRYDANLQPELPRNADQIVNRDVQIPVWKPRRHLIRAITAPQIAAYYPPNEQGVSELWALRKECNVSKIIIIRGAVLALALGLSAPAFAQSKSFWAVIRCTKRKTASFASILRLVRYLFARRPTRPGIARRWATLSKTENPHC